jgi:hypothetical protein
MNENELNFAVKNNFASPIPKFCVTDINSKQIGSDVALFWDEKIAGMFVESVELLKLISSNKECEYSAVARAILDLYKRPECEEDEI